jgi:hypothetical protein
MGRRRAPLSQTRGPNHHPVVRGAIEIVDAGGLAYDCVEERAGVGHRTLRHWRNGRMPQVANLDAVLQVMGYRLSIVKMDGE